jgi:hypothetical protein
MRCARVATRGEDSFLSFWAANGEWGDKKEREGQGVGLSRWPAISLKNATTNCQSGLVVGEEWERDSAAAERRRGTITHHFRGQFERQKIKCKNTLRGGGRQPIDGKSHDNQPKYSFDDKGGFRDEMRPRKNVGGGVFTSFGVANEGKKK